MQDLAGKTAVITGGGSGIGRALAGCLAAESMRLVLADVSAGELEEAAAELRGSGAEARSIVADVREPESIDAVAAAAYEEFGSVDLLCANAGIMGPPIGSIWEVAIEDWRRVFDVNVFGMVNTFRAFVPRMIAAGTEGHVLVTASVRSLMIGALGSQYQTSKHADLAMADILRKQLAAKGAPIGVSALLPGPVYTNALNREMAHAKATGVELKMPNPADLPRDDVQFGPMSAEDTAKAAVEGIRAGRSYIFSHAESEAGVRSWLEPILATFSS